MHGIVLVWMTFYGGTGAGTSTTLLEHMHKGTLVHWKNKRKEEEEKNLLSSVLVLVLAWGEKNRLSDTNGLQDGFRLGLHPTKCQLADPSDFWNCRNNLFLMEEEDGVGYKLYNRRDRGCMSLYRYRDTTRASQSD